MTSFARIAIVVVGLVVVASGLSMCGRVASRGRYAAPYSSIGAGPHGTRGLYLAAAGLGAAPMRWTRDLSGLPEGGTLLAFGGCSLPVRRPVRRYEATALDAWVRRGGLLVVAGATDYLPPDVGVSLRRPPGQCGGGVSELLGLDEPIDDEGHAPIVEEFPDRGDVADVPADSDEDEAPPPRWATPASGILAGIDDVPMVQPARVIVDEGFAYETLLTIADEPAGVLVPRERGAIVVLSSATPFENEWIRESLGAVILFRILDARSGSGALVFDEYHLGVGTSRSIVQYLRSLGAGPFIAQLAFAITLLLLRLGSRLGPPVASPASRPAGTEPYVGAIGGLYARSGDLSGVVEVLRRRALSRVARHHRTEPQDTGALVDRARARGGEKSGAAVVTLVEPVVEVTSSRAMVERVRAIDALELAATGEDETKGSRNR
jgi:hypothetical protein